MDSGSLSLSEGDVGPLEKNLKAVIKNVDNAVDTCSTAISKFNIERDIAMYVKKEFDRKYGTTWHCVVGKNFGSFVTHETKNFIYFYLGPIAILLWKTS